MSTDASRPDNVYSHQNAEPVWRQPGWIEQTQILLNSYSRWLGRELIERDGGLLEQSQRLFEAPFVVVAHGTQADPVLCYGNQTALTLWETDLETLLALPSRLTAEPVHRDERAKMLERTQRDGFIDDYAGVRISTSGQRFRIEQAIVWNLVNADGQPVGQAATFSSWTRLPPVSEPR